MKRTTIKVEPSPSHKIILMPCHEHLECPPRNFDGKVLFPPYSENCFCYVTIPRPEPLEPSSGGQDIWNDGILDFFWWLTMILVAGGFITMVFMLICKLCKT